VNLTACKEKPDEHRSREATKIVAQIFNLSEKISLSLSLFLFLVSLSLAALYLCISLSLCSWSERRSLRVNFLYFFLFLFVLFLVFRFCPSVSVNFVGGTVDIGKDAVIPGVMV
jgi:hypothetical protein